MNNRTTAMILTVASIVLCGIPGLCLFLFGVITSIGVMPYTATLNGETQTGTLPAGYGIVGLCLAVFLIAIPVVVGFLTLRNKPAASAQLPPNEPLPPAM